MFITDYSYTYVPIKPYVKIKQIPKQGITYSPCYVAKRNLKIMEDNRVPPLKIAKDMVSKTSKQDALLLAENAINEKRKEKPSSLMTMVWVEELNYLKEVKKCIEQL